MLGKPSPIDWTMGGLAPGSIQVHGSRARPSILARQRRQHADGSRTSPTTWEITSAGGGTVNTTLDFAGMRNLTGGTANR